MIPNCKICQLPLTSRNNNCYWKCSRCLSSIVDLPPDQVPTSRYQIQFYDNLEAQKETIILGQYDITCREHQKHQKHQNYTSTIIGRQFWDERIQCINYEEIFRIHKKIFDLNDLPATEAKLKLILTFL